MTQDIRQWLAEIQALQQKLVAVQQEREQAYASAANWRHLYEVEARQRRADTEAVQITLAELEAKLAEQQPPTPDAANYNAVLRRQVEQWQTLEEVQMQLLQVLQERDRLVQALQVEQQNHAQTRQDLTAALGDTMELLMKARSAPAISPASDEGKSGEGTDQGKEVSAKTPSPGRPHLHLVQFPS